MDLWRMLQIVEKEFNCKIVTVLDIQSLQRRIENGDRFIVYQYSISLIVGNIFTASPAPVRLTSSTPLGV